MFPQDRQGTWQPMMQQLHTNIWADPSAIGGFSSHRMATPQFAPHSGSAGPTDTRPVFLNTAASESQQFSSMPSMHPAPTMLRRNDSGGQPSWLQGGAARAPAVHMDVFASTGGSVGAWALSQPAEMLSISENNAEEHRHLEASQHPVCLLVR